MNVLARQLLGMLSGLALAGCGDNAISAIGPTPSPSPVVLSATPSTYTFALDHNAPQLITVTRSSGAFASLLLSVADPQHCRHHRPDAGRSERYVFDHPNRARLDDGKGDRSNRRNDCGACEHRIVWSPCIDARGSATC